MIYLIGGAPRVGKSQMANMLIAQKPMLSLSCDLLYDLDQVKNLDGFEHADILEKGRAFYPTLKQLLVNISLRAQDCVVEGEVILPEFIPELENMYELRSCFLGLSSTSLDSIVANGGFFNWPKYKIDHHQADEVRTLAQRTVKRSAIIRESCENLGLKYFDMANTYEQTRQEAIKYLLH